ncbi:hypothetical protein HMPREF1557_00265 [Streptococcus sobrinus W1703]|uniref:Uncharacterized protein n=1 Tax=Streptococcus sobrinus W1703 TaxID=1227275 RepID=U2JEJ7_9STRE|nr:hypothetical protein HMPREF1557_00265 [Streptococcus sobrinus W1703]
MFKKSQTLGLEKLKKRAIIDLHDVENKRKLCEIFNITRASFLLLES